MTTDQQKLLNGLLDQVFVDNDKLDEWDMGFLESLDANRSTELNDYQKSKLNQIWNRVFP